MCSLLISNFYNYHQKIIEDVNRVNCALIIVKIKVLRLNGNEESSL